MGIVCECESMFRNKNAIESKWRKIVLAALTGLARKFASVETTVSELAARQAALEGAHIMKYEPFAVGDWVDLD